MGDRSPPLFDDGGDLPEVGPDRRRRTFGSPGRRRGDDDPGRPRAGRSARSRGGGDVGDDIGETGVDEPGFDDGSRRRGGGGRPNYLIRRAIAVGGAVVLIAIAAVVASRFISTDDDTPGRTEVEWDAVVLIDDRTVRLVEPGDGDQISALTLPTSTQQIDWALTGTTLVTLDDGVLELRDLLTRQVLSPVEIGDDWQLRRLPGDVVVAGSPSGAGLTIVDANVQDAFNIEDVAEFDEPRILLDDVLASPIGTHLAAAETNTFQSALVDISNRTVVPFAGLIVALSDDTVVTAQRLGSEAEIEFYDLTKSRRDAVDVEAPEVVLITGDSTGVTVADNGMVYRLDAADGDVSESARLGVDPSSETSQPPPVIDLTYAHAVANGTRALVGTADTAYLVDDNGEVIGEYDGELLSSFDPRLECAVVGSRTRALGSSMIDLRTGTAVEGLIGGIPSSTSIDGCTAVIGSGPTSVVYEYGEEVDIVLPAGTASVTPDGTAVVVAARTGVTLHRFGDDDVTTLSERFAEVTFLDRSPAE